MEKSGITLLGLGTGSLGELSQETIDGLAGVEQIYLRTAYLPLAEELKTTHLLHAFDDLLSDIPFDQDVVEKIADTIIASASDTGKVTYAVPGHPLIADLTCTEIIRKAKEQNITVRIIAGKSLLDEMMALLPLEFSGGQITVVDMLKLQLESFHTCPPSQPMVILNAVGENIGSVLKAGLSSIYPLDHRLAVIDFMQPIEDRLIQTRLETLDRSLGEDHNYMLYVPALAFGSAFEDFQAIIEQLRSPEGCPWDREQTHESLKPFLLEETYEALEALDQTDMSGLQEELGDLLLQIVLHAQIGVEAGEFTMRDVLQTISNKMIRRHPHVFADGKAKDALGVVQKWQEIKADERKQNGLEGSKGMLDGVPQSLPALVQSQTVQARAKVVGFDWLNISDVHAKIEEELQELADASNPEEQFSEMGDVFFALVNLARWLDVDSEAALRESTRRFKQRFSYIEQSALKKGKAITDMTFEEMDALWDEAKVHIKQDHVE